MTGEKTDAILAKNRAILTFLKGGKDTPQWTTQKITGISWFRACVPLSTEGIIILQKKKAEILRFQPSHFE